jgi:hypothetical protein
MAQKVVHRKGEETHETENLVREILKMDWDTYEGILKEYAPLFIPKPSPCPSQSESSCDIFESGSLDLFVVVHALSSREVSESV